jgi:alkanesulfonate monooxygenase SsuD/methylene tetrahydromethanopterin reductase-like flavin-dependent oxidoreductase (luciferase family)
MAHPLRFGLKNGGQDTTIGELRGLWRIADEAEFDHVWVFDHLASIGAGGADRPVFEGWSLQAAIAASTQHARIGCLVTGNTYRNPALLAKIAVTVDHLSNGRLEFGIGAAWAQVEHEMYSIPGLDHRVGRLNESLQILKSLWTQPRTTFEGRYYTMRDAICNPKPIQQPHPPIWIGAGGERTLLLTARHADVWNASGPEDLTELGKRLDEACMRIGRDPATIRRSVQYAWDGQDRSRLLDQAGDRLRRGFTEHILMMPSGRAVEVASRAAEALPELRKLS